MLFNCCLKNFAYKAATLNRITSKFSFIVLLGKIGRPTIILEIVSFLVKLSIAASGAEPDNYHQRTNARVASKAAKGRKGTLSNLRQFLATENLLKTMKNVFYFMSKALFVLKEANKTNISEE